MHIDRIGSSPVKGASHDRHDWVDLVLDGPPGGRAGYRLGNGETSFGVDAVTTTVGRVRTRDPVSLVGRG